MEILIEHPQPCLIFQKSWIGIPISKKWQSGFTLVLYSRQMKNKFEFVFQQLHFVGSQALRCHWLNLVIQMDSSSVSMCLLSVLSPSTFVH